MNSRLIWAMNNNNIWHVIHENYRSKKEILMWKLLKFISVQNLNFYSTV